MCLAVKSMRSAKVPNGEYVISQSGVNLRGADGSEVRSDVMSRIFDRVTEMTGSEIRSALDSPSGGLWEELSTGPEKNSERAIFPSVRSVFSMSVAEFRKADESRNAEKFRLIDEAAFREELREQSIVEGDIDALVLRSGQRAPVGGADRVYSMLRNLARREAECRANGKIAHWTREGQPVRDRRGHSFQNLLQEAPRATSDLDGRIKNMNRNNTHYSSEDRDASRFSLARALRSGMDGSSLDGIERELLDEGVAEARSAGIATKGFILSSRAFTPYDEYRSAVERRALSVTGGSNGDAGGVLVQTNKMNLLAELFDSLVVVRSGARVFTGLSGANLDFPRISDSSTVSGKAETASADETQATFDTMLLKPNRLPTYIDISRQLLLQNDEALLNTVLQDHLRNKLQSVMEKAFFTGTGTNEAEGILEVSGIGDVVLGTNGGQITHEKLSELIRSVASQNADQDGRFVINSAVADKLRTTAKITGTDSRTLINDTQSNTLLGRRFLESNAIPGDLTKGTGNNLSAVVYGNFADYYIAQFSGMEFLVDPMTLAAQGIIRIHCSIFYDGGLIRPASMAAIQDVVTS